MCVLESCDQCLKGEARGSAPPGPRGLADYTSRSICSSIMNAQAVINEPVEVRSEHQSKGLQPFYRRMTCSTCPDRKSRKMYRTTSSPQMESFSSAAVT